MSDEIITRLVVGERMRVTLGVPVGQRIDAGAKTAALRWKDGGWIESTGSKLSKAMGPSTFQVPLQRIAAAKSTASRKYGLMALASLVAVSIGAAGVLVLRNQAESSLPIAPAVAANPGAVKVVTAPYAPELRNEGALPIAPLPVANPVAESVPGAQGPLPRSLPQVVASTTTPGKQPQPAAAKASPPPAKSKEEPAQRVPAVLLDDPSPAAGQRPANPTPAPAANKPAANNPVAVAAPKPENTTRPPAARGTGLVAITPDGKSAVFTNPKTRLPEQFKVGDQLPNGETVRSVDYKEGRVLTSSKEYSLE